MTRHNTRPDVMIMFSHRRHALAAALLFGLAVPCNSQERPNVLFVAFDDLNDWIPLLDETAPIAMPNLDRLAGRGMTFRRAYCAAPQCNPSRVAVMSGMQPTSTGVYQNNADWKRAMPEAVMLPRYFRENGYRTVGAGKLFHHVHPYFHDDASFDDYFPFFTDRLPAGKLNGLTRALSPEGEWESLAPTFDWGPSPTPEAEMLDTLSADFAVEFLARRHAKPFFLAVGFFRPHFPYFAPQRCIERYDPQTMPLPPLQENDLEDVPAGAAALMKRWTRMFRGIQQAPDAEGTWRRAIAWYAAGATFADEQLGRVLDALDASPHRGDTIIVAWSDHGYHLGEKDHWTKFVLWEKTTRVPLVIVAPGTAKAGTSTAEPVSLVDLYATLVDLCGLPARDGLDSRSLAPLLKDPEAAAARPAIISDSPGNHAVRTKRWRYIHYADGTEELYDHEADPHEWKNLASDRRHQAVIAEHRRWLPQREADPAPVFGGKAPYVQ